MSIRFICYGETYLLTLIVKLENSTPLSGSKGSIGVSKIASHGTEREHWQDKRNKAQQSQNVTRVSVRYLGTKLHTAD